MNGTNNYFVPVKVQSTVMSSVYAIHHYRVNRGNI